MAAKKKDKRAPGEIRNAKALRDYTIEERLEAGIVLSGTEVKSIRAGKAQLAEGFCRFHKEELFIYGLNIEQYAFDTMGDFKPRRERKLLLKRRQLDKWQKAVEAGGKAVVPLRLYFKEALVKVEIGLGVGKKLFDKREDLKKKAVMRDLDQMMKERVYKK